MPITYGQITKFVTDGRHNHYGQTSNSLHYDKEKVNKEITAFLSNIRNTDVTDNALAVALVAVDRTLSAPAKNVLMVAITDAHDGKMDNWYGDREKSEGHDLTGILLGKSEFTYDPRNPGKLIKGQSLSF